MSIAWLNFAHSLADLAREQILPHFRQPVAVDLKADASPVTDVDRDTEALLRREIEAHLPDHGLYGEEYGAMGAQREYCWVLDPIDGTRSFICGMPTFGTLIALLHHGRPLLGVLDMPALSERWSALDGHDAHYNGHVCRSSGCTQLSQARLFSTSIDLFAGAEAIAFDRLSREVAMRRFGADCYAYGLLASGHVDLVVEAGLQPYDYLAQVRIIEAAGGCISDWQGRAPGLDSDGRIIAAATPELHRAALAVLNAGEATA